MDHVLVGWISQKPGIRLGLMNRVWGEVDLDPLF